MIAVLQWQPQRPKEGLGDRTGAKEFYASERVMSSSLLKYVEMKFKHDCIILYMCIYIYEYI